MKLLAPNGKPSNLTPEQYRLVRTPAFKAWFGDWEKSPKTASKVIDSNGEPLVVYHGTNSKFNKFEPTKPNFYAITEGTYFFTDIKKVAENFGDFIFPVFLQIDNPTYLDGIYSGRFNTWTLYDDKGNYGFIVSNSDTGGGFSTEYAVEHSNQIKLADGTNTTFDSNNPDIRYNNGGLTMKKPKAKLLAPNGKPTNLTPEQYRLVRTPAFKAWFGDWENSLETASKVVDENGEPLVCNHSSREKDIDIFYGGRIFRTKKNQVKPIWFTYKEFYEYADGEDIIQYRCFLNIKNIFDYSKQQDEFNLKRYFIEQNGEMLPDYDFNMDWDAQEQFNLPAYIYEMGYDGYKFTDEYSIVIFNSNQIKLADGTNTTFDSNNPDIRYAEGGGVEEKLYRNTSIHWLNDFLKKGVALPNTAFISFSKEEDSGGMDSFGETNIEFSAKELYKQGAIEVEYNVDFFEENPKICMYVTGYKGEEDYYQKKGYEGKEDFEENGQDDFNTLMWETVIEDYEHEAEVVIKKLKYTDGLILSVNGKKFENIKNKSDSKKRSKKLDEGGHIEEPTEFWGDSAAGVLLICKKTGRVLLFHRSEDVYEPETWGIISGKIDEDENPKDAILRELIEETKLSEEDANRIILKPSYVYKKGSFTFYNYLGFVENEFAPTLNWENTNYKWCDIGEYPNPLHFGVLKLLENVNLKKEISGEVLLANNPDIRYAEGGEINQTEESIKRFLNNQKLIDDEPLRNWDNMNIGDTLNVTDVYKQLPESQASPDDGIYSLMVIPISKTDHFIRGAVNREAFASDDYDGWQTENLNKIKKTFDSYRREPIIVSEDEDGLFTVIDGHHRLTVANELGRKSILALVREFKNNPIPSHWAENVNGISKRYHKIKLELQNIPNPAITNINFVNKIDEILNPENKYELGGELTLTSEQVENKLGRKLHWWNDDVVTINGANYKKVFLKPEYKIEE